MLRVPEPELMDDEAQARAYAAADFAEPHEHFICLFRTAFPHWRGTGCVLDLGCGPADVTLRFARAFPHCSMHGVDGAPAMLRLGQAAVDASACTDRVKLFQRYLPCGALPRARYDAVISNSLLHHLADPAVLWEAVATYSDAGAPVFVMDLMRPSSVADANVLVERYAAGEHDLLRRDFFHSLLAAYLPDEVATQLHAAGLDQLRVEVVSDRHFVVSGVMP